MAFFLEPCEACDDVRIATLHVDDLPSAMYGLLQLFFYEPSDEPRFISMSRVRDRFTLVADAARLEGVPGLSVDPTEWAVLRVDEQSLHNDEQSHAAGDNVILDTPGIVSRLTGPLADASIPVFHLSTYDSEFILVPRAQLGDALACFSAQPPTLAQSDVAARRASDLAHTHTYPLEVLSEHPTAILRLEKPCRELHMGALLRLLFMPMPHDTPQALVSLTESPDNDLSILTALTPWWQEHCRAFPTGLSGLDLEQWVPVCIRNAGLNETGIVAAMASVLSAQRISMLGCSTLSGSALATDFTLVPCSRVEEATAAFSAAGFEVGLEHDEQEGTASAL